MGISHAEKVAAFGYDPCAKLKYIGKVRTPRITNHSGDSHESWDIYFNEKTGAIDVCIEGCNGTYCRGTQSADGSTTLHPELDKAFRQLRNGESKEGNPGCHQKVHTASTPEGSPGDDSTKSGEIAQATSNPLEDLAQKIVGHPVSIVKGKGAYTDGKIISIVDPDTRWPGFPAAAREDIALTMTGHEAVHIKLFNQEAQKLGQTSMSAEEFYRLFADPLSPDQASIPYVRLLSNLIEDRLVDRINGTYVTADRVHKVNKLFVWERQSGNRRSIAELESEGTPGRCASFLEAIFQKQVYNQLIESFYSPELEEAANTANEVITKFGEGHISRIEAVEKVLEALTRYCPPSWSLPSTYEPPGTGAPIVFIPYEWIPGGTPGSLAGQDSAASKTETPQNDLLKQIQGLLEQLENETEVTGEEGGHRTSIGGELAGVYTAAELEVAFRKGADIVNKIARDLNYSEQQFGFGTWDAEELVRVLESQDYQRINSCKRDPTRRVGLSMVVDLSESCQKESEMFIAIACGAIQPGVEIFLGYNGNAVPTPLPQPCSRFRTFTTAHEWIKPQVQTALRTPMISFDDLMQQRKPGMVMILGDHDGIDQYNRALQKYKRTRFVWLSSCKYQTSPPEGWSHKNYYPGVLTPAALIATLRRLRQ